MLPIHRPHSLPRLHRALVFVDHEPQTPEGPFQPTVDTLPFCLRPHEDGEVVRVPYDGMASILPLLVQLVRQYVGQEGDRGVRRLLN